MPPPSNSPETPGRRAHPRDPYATHKTPEIKAWSSENPKLRDHFTRTSPSWLNLAEVWFSLIERQTLQRADVASVAELNARIRAVVTGWNNRCHPFVWTKTSLEVLTKAHRPTTSETGH